MFSFTSRACKSVWQETVLRFFLSSRKRHNVQDWMTWCTNSKRCFLHSKHWTSQEFTNWSMFYIHSQVSHLFNWEKNRNSTFVENINTRRDPSGRRCPVPEMDDESFSNCGLFSIGKSKTTETWFRRKPNVMTVLVLLARMHKSINGISGTHRLCTSWVKNHIRGMCLQVNVLCQKREIDVVMDVQICMIRRLGVAKSYGCRAVIMVFRKHYRV